MYSQNSICRWNFYTMRIEDRLQKRRYFLLVEEILTKLNIRGFFQKKLIILIPFMIGEFTVL